LCQITSSVTEEIFIYNSSAVSKIAVFVVGSFSLPHLV